MRGALRRRLAVGDGEAGMTLVEILVAAAMSIVLVAGATSMLISAVRQQPELSERAQNVTTARWQLDRMTREIRNGVSVTTSAASSVSFVARVRRTACGGAVPTSSSTAAIQCQIAYSCTTTSCTRTERDPGETTGGSTTTIVTGIDSSSVFCFVPSAEEDPTDCGPAKSGTAPTYVGVTLNVPNPSGPSALTVSDGASLRTATFTG
jgi:type II secretory pathway pseudopilin PulG